MASGYPSALDVFPINKSDDTLHLGDHAPLHNNLADAVNKIEAELGTDPSGASANLATRLTAIEALAPPTSNLTDTNFAAGASFYANYKNLYNHSGTMASAGAATYPITESADGSSLQASGLGLVLGSVVRHQLTVFQYTAADRAVSGKSEKLRIQAAVTTNGTAPAITFTYGLYPVTFAGATTNLTATLGTVVSGSTVAIASPGANATTRAVGTDFTPPSDGVYCFGVVNSGLTATNAITLHNCQLQSHHVA